MKARAFLISIVIICFLSQAAISYGQDSIRMTIKIRQITLKGDSGEQEVSLPLRDSLSYINFEIKAIITSGEVTVELFDPYGEKYGNFSLAGSTNSNNNVDALIRGKTYFAEASGSLVRYVKLPKRGMWKAKVITKNAVGAVEFNLTKGVTIIKVN
jgi:hypothetical protein